MTTPTPVTELATAPLARRARRRRALVVAGAAVSAAWGIAARGSALTELTRETRELAVVDGRRSPRRERGRAPEEVDAARATIQPFTDARDLRADDRLPARRATPTSARG